MSMFVVLYHCFLREERLHLRLRTGMVICFILIVITVLTSCEEEAAKSTAVLPSHQYGIQYSKDSNHVSKVQWLHQFIYDKLSGKFGVYTNFIDTEQNELAATGHEVLSESMGLLMRYYALTREHTQFDNTWKLVEQTFSMDSGFSYRYSPKLNKTYTVNAAIDDLRIIRALYEAEEVFGERNYGQLADNLGSRFMQHNVQAGKLVDFYDNELNIANSFVTLCYIDLRTLQLIAQADTKNDVVHNMLPIIQGGYLSDAFPFYETRYLYDTEQYESEDINTVESLLTILSLVEVGQHNPKSIEYIKAQVQQGTLYGKYSRDGKPLTTIQSTAIYAITAMIASELGDKVLYEQSISRMEQFQVLEQQSELYGAYGDAGSLQAYSFDNLQALLAYAY